MDDLEELQLALLTVIISLCLTRNAELGRRRRSNRSVWILTLLGQKEARGTWNAVIPDLQAGLGSRRIGTFSNFIRMDGNCFVESMRRVAPLIRRRDTQLRQAIPPQQRLAVTLIFFSVSVYIHRTLCELKINLVTYNNNNCPAVRLVVLHVSIVAVFR